MCSGGTPRTSWEEEQGKGETAKGRISGGKNSSYKVGRRLPIQIHWQHDGSAEKYRGA
jgi:hypothetical protein